jgi:hypothetical protein
MPSIQTTFLALPRPSAHSNWLRVSVPPRPNRPYEDREKPCASHPHQNNKYTIAHYLVFVKQKITLGATGGDFHTTINGLRPLPTFHPTFVFYPLLRRPVLICTQTPAVRHLVGDSVSRLARAQRIRLLEPFP